jgi:hypothetical protein
MKEPFPPNWSHGIPPSDNNNCIFPTAISTTSNLHKTTEMGPRKEATRKNFVKLMDELKYNESDQKYSKGVSLSNVTLINHPIYNEKAGQVT